VKTEAPPNFRMFDRVISFRLYSTRGPAAKKYDRAWRKSRIAARLLYRKAEGPLPPNYQRLAQLMANDPEVSNRLIQQALYYLGGRRKHELDRKLVARRN
jgi:hypothetical protein